MATAASGAASGSGTWGSLKGSGALRLPAASSVAAKGTAVLAVKVAAAVVLTVVVSTAGVSLLPKQLSPIVAGRTSRLLQRWGKRTRRDCHSTEERDRPRHGRWREAFSQNPGFHYWQFQAKRINTLCSAEQLAASILDYFMRGTPYTKPNRPWGFYRTQYRRGWPTPTIDEALRFADEIQTDQLYVTDGAAGHGTEFISQRARPSSLLHLEMVRIGSSNANAATRFWPIPEELAVDSGKKVQPGKICRGILNWFTDRIIRLSWVYKAHKR